MHFDLLQWENTLLFFTVQQNFVNTPSFLKGKLKAWQLIALNDSKIIF